MLYQGISTFQNVCCWLLECSGVVEVEMVYEMLGTLLVSCIVL